MSYGYHHHHHCHHDDGGCLIMACILLVLGLVTMPITGLVMCVSGSDDGDRILGVFLMVVGIAVWLMIASS